jgi:hypothetical protein
MERALQIAHRRALEAERRIFGLLEGKEPLEIALDESIRFSPKRNATARSKSGWNTVQCQYIGQQLSAYCCACHADPYVRNQ